MIRRRPEALQTINSIVNFRYTTIYNTTGIRCYYCFNLWHISVTGSDRTGDTTQNTLWTTYLQYTICSAVFTIFTIFTIFYLLSLIVSLPLKELQGCTFIDRFNLLNNVCKVNSKFVHLSSKFEFT